MSGGFFRGTTADQDTRFSNKHAKLLKSKKFPPELENLVDMTKVKMDVMRPWIAHRVTELLGFEDEVLINFIYGLLEEKVVNGKEIQISLTGFMEKNTGKFMKELWTHLLSAQENASGVPQQFLDAKEEETRKKQEDTDRISRELKRAKEKEGREADQERVIKMDREVDAATLDPNSRSTRTKSSSKWSVDERGTDDKNGSKSTAHHSPSPPRGTRSRSVSRSISNSRSNSRSRSMSASPKPPRRSFTPPPPRTRGRSPSPARRRLRSPVRRRSRSPMWRRRSRSPIRRRSRSPLRRRSRSPIRRRSRSPLRRRSRSPIRRRSRSPVRRRMRSPVRRRSPSPFQRRQRSPIRRGSQSSASPPRQVSASPVRPRSPSPVRRRSPSPVRRRYNQRGPSPPRHRSPSPGWRSRRTNFSSRQRSPPSPRRSMSTSPSPRLQQRSPVDGHRGVQRSVVAGRSLERDTKGRRASHNGEPALSSPQHSSPMGSVSPPPPARSPSEERSPIFSKRQRESMHTKERLDNVEAEEMTFSRAEEDKHAKKKSSPEKLTSHQRRSKNDDVRKNYNREPADEPPRNRKDILSRDTEKGTTKADEMKDSRATNNNTQSGSLDSGSDERKQKRSKKKDVTSDDDDDDSHDSHTEDRKEAKKRRKEEKRLKKEERRKRREERRRKKAEKHKVKTGGNVSPSSDENEDQKKLEIELREKALESLRAKKGSIGR